MTSKNNGGHNHGSTDGEGKQANKEQPSQLELGTLAPADMDDSTLRSTVVGEYVLGTLASSECRACEALFECSEEWAEEKVLWETLLSNFAGALEPVEPPGAVLARVRRQIGLATGPIRSDAQSDSTNARRKPVEGVTFWRASAAVSAIAAGIMAVALFAPSQLPFGSEPTQVVSPDSQAAENYIAMLQEPESKVYWLVKYLPESGEIELRRQGDYALRPDRDLQLWWVPAAGKPESVAVLPRSAQQSLSLPQEIPTDASLAISLEPRGGSDTDQPTGPVLALAGLIKL